MHALSIVIPVYNAEMTIGDLCRALVSQLAGSYRLQIVLVNDCSQDDTDAVCKQLHAEFPETVTYARLSRNFGEHNAVIAGLNQATGDSVVIMDDDFQNPPEEVPRLVAELQKGYDVVYCRYPEKRDSLARNIASYLNGTMARVILHKPANLYLSSFKALNRFLVDQIITNTNPKPYIDAIILSFTRNIGTLEVRHDRRCHGRSGYTLVKLASLWGNMIVSCSLIPLRLMVFIGLALSLLGLFSVADMLIRNSLPQLKDLSDLDSLRSVSSLFRGLQLLATGIVGEYVGRIYLHLNRDPQFVIREKYCSPAGEREEGHDA